MCVCVCVCAPARPPPHPASPPPLRRQREPEPSLFVSLFPSPIYTRALLPLTAARKWQRPPAPPPSPAHHTALYPAGDVLRHCRQRGAGPLGGSAVCVSGGRGRPGLDGLQWQQVKGAHNVLSRPKHGRLLLTMGGAICVCTWVRMAGCVFCVPDYCAR